MSGAAYSYSVLFMLGMFFTLLLSFGGACYRLYRKHVRLTQQPTHSPMVGNSLRELPAESTRGAS
jgi:hypothetical protein